MTSLRPIPTLAFRLALSLTVAACALARASAEPAQKTCDTAGLSLPRGFCATVFADKIGHARQLAVGPDGTVYVNTWSGQYYKNGAPPEGGFIVTLKDTDGDGKANEIARFGPSFAQGGHGGTGVALHDGFLYAEINDKIVRYPLKDGRPQGEAQTVVSGLPLDGDHPMHPFAISKAGDLYVDLASASNACERKNRMPQSPGRVPCVEKETRGGVWRYDAGTTDQKFSPAERYATGLRNAEGLAFDASGRFYATQHGRDQLAENWPRLYTREQGRELPAEVLVEVKKGADYGWPECYYDATQKKLVLGPEYGGDGGQKVGLCADRAPPVAAFPAHWAPNDLKIYDGDQFPPGYRDGAFIAFHGSWNRAPGPQGGYNVVFQPLADGKASGSYVIFADGFAGPVKEPGRAQHRPSGLAVAPDGALFISDDQGGRIWRVRFAGGPAIRGVEAATPPERAAAASGSAEPPEGVHPDAGDIAGLAIPKGASADQVALGARIFRGEVGGATCGGCHGSDGRGSPVGADLASGRWLWSDGSLKGIVAVIRNGVPEPKEHGGAMPPMGGVDLSNDEVTALAAFVAALGEAK